MQPKAHWQAIYDNLRASLDGAGYTDVEVVHTTSIDTQTGAGLEAPFVVYRQDVERSHGTVGKGELNILNSGWVITSYSEDLEDGLAYLGEIIDGITTGAGVADTADGYRTSGMEVIGIQTLYENDFKVYASHLRVLWERTLIA